MEKIRRQNMKFSINQIMNTLPHRYPFLLVDRIVEKGENYCVGIKCVTINECFFMGHFPENPVMPGNLIIESLAQTSAFVNMPDDQEKAEKEMEMQKRGFLSSVNVKFQSPVIPGDVLYHKVTLIKNFKNMSLFSGETTISNNIVIAKGEFAIAYV